MSQTSCINHPSGSHFVVIYDWQVTLCEGNTTTAALLSFFERWHNIKLAMRPKNIQSNNVAASHGDERSQDETTLQFHSEQELIDGIQSIGKRDSIRKAIKWLESKGFISIHSNPNKRYAFDKTRYFQFYPDLINEWISGLSDNLPSMSKNQSRSLENQLPQSENASAITEHTPENASEHNPPLPPQGERGCEKKFGFEIPEEPMPKSSASLLSQPEITHEVASTIVETTIATPTEIQKTSGYIHPAVRMESRFNLKQTVRQQRRDYLEASAHPSLVFSENTPWLEPNSTPENPIFHKPFISWGGECLMKFSQKTVERAEGDYETKLINDPRKISIEWRTYNKTLTHKAAVIAARINNDVTVGQDELENLAKHQRAFTEVTPESTENIDPKILASAQQPSAKPRLLESVATVSDDVWDTIAATTQQEQAQFIKPPEGATDTQMYTRTAKPEDADYFRNLHEKKTLMQNQNPESQPPQDSEELKNKIRGLIEHKAMKTPSNDERHQMKMQEALNRKLAHWNALLESGIPSVIADVEKQAKAQGYEIMDGQIVEAVDF